MKKLLYITNIPSPYRVEFWNELGKYYDVTVWFEAQNESNREWNIDGMGTNFKYRFLKSFTIGLDNHVSLEVIKRLGIEQFDIYILGSYSSITEMLAIMWFKFRRKKFFLNSDGGFPGKENIIKKSIKSFFISRASYWLSSGSNCTEYLCYYGAKRDRVWEYPFASVSYSREELSQFDADEKEKFKKENSLRGKVILTVGQLIPRKGIDFLIKVFMNKISSDVSLTDVSLIIVGSGPEENYYKDLAKEHGNENKNKNIIFKPFMQMKDLIRFYKAADIFILPTRYDIWGLVLNEAMSFGLPVIATSMCGAAKDLIKEGENGYVVPVESEEFFPEKRKGILSKRLKELLEDDEKIKSFGARSREVISGYTIFKMVEAHVKAIESVGVNK